MQKSLTDNQVTAVSTLHSVLGVLGVLVSLLLAGGAWVGHIRGNEPPDVRLVIGVITGLGVVGSLVLSAGLIATGRAIRRRRHHGLCVVVSVLLCPCFPFGTAVGAYSLYVLLDREVKGSFCRPQEAIGGDRRRSGSDHNGVLPKPTPTKSH